MGGRGELLVRLEASGHRNIRATHDATIELATDDDITPRATCVIGVGARVVDGSPFPIAGPLRVTLEAGGVSDVIDAIANPWLKSTDAGLVLRRGPARLDDTLATGASIGADGLDRALVEVLRDPAQMLTVSVHRARARADGRAQLVLGRVRAQGAKGGRKAAVLAAELDAAGVVVADDAGARRLARGDGDAARAALAAGGRVLVLGTDELLGRCVPELLDGVNALHLESFGMPATVAAAAFLGGAAPVTMLPHVSNAAEASRALGAAALGSRVVFSTSASRGSRVIAALPAEVLAGVAVLDADTPSERAVRGEPARLGHALDGARGSVVLALPAGSTGGADDRPLPPTLLGALVEEGVAPATIAAALGRQPGWSRNGAYRAVTNPGGE
ncbi:MAG: DUF371 domain-containing protein [Actinobacteria bacterium]|nr:DUF371 domain-containing protein [Actinomycetota bacterium]